MSASDDELIASAVNGDADSLGTLLERYGPIVRGGLKMHKKWQSVLEASDVMQVTYLEAFLQIKRFMPSGGDSFLAWLARIANNNLRDAIKELSRAKRPNPARRVRSTLDQTDPDAASQQFLLELVGGTTTTASQFAGRAEARHFLDEALRGLPEDHRRVIELYDLDGRSAAEAASIMGRSAAAIYMLRARAHDHLLVLLGSESKFFSHVSLTR